MHARSGFLRRFAVALMAAFALHASVEAAPGGAVAEHVAKLDGVDIHYYEAGSGDATPVVLLHGYAETSHMWLPLIPKIDGKRVVIAPDLRGAGGSSKPESGYDKKTLAQDIHALAKS